MGEQRVFLEHGVHRTLVGRYARDVLSFQQHLAGRRSEARDEAEGGGFAAAGGSQQRHKLFVMDVEVQPIQDALTIKFHYDVSQRNDHRVVSFLSYILLVTQIRKKTGVYSPILPSH